MKRNCRTAVCAILLALCEEGFSTENLSGDSTHTDGQKIFDALSIHLVDEIGTLEDAVRWAAEAAGDSFEEKARTLTDALVEREEKKQKKENERKLEQTNELGQKKGRGR